MCQYPFRVSKCSNIRVMNRDKCRWKPEVIPKNKDYCELCYPCFKYLLYHSGLTNHVKYSIIKKREDTCLTKRSEKLRTEFAMKYMIIE